MCNKRFRDLAVSPHSHAEFSLDGGSTSQGKIEHAVKIGRLADTLTDHGILSGLATQWMAAQKMRGKDKLPKDFRIIQGIEAYMIDEHRPWKPNRKGSSNLVPQYYHLTIHFKTMDAYFYFCKLSKTAEERALIKYGERKPLIKFEELEPIVGHITIGSGCLVGPIQKNALVGRYDLAEQMYTYLRNLVGPDNFYVEVFPHVIIKNWARPVFDKETKKMVQPGKFEPILSVRDWEGDPEDAPQPWKHECEVDGDCVQAVDIQKHPNLYVIEMAEKFGDRVLISLDDHYGPLEDKAVQEARLGNGQENWRFYGSFHAQTSDEAAERLQRQLGVPDKKIEEWIDNSYQFVENFDKYKFPNKDDQVLLPSTDMVYELKYEGKTSREIFWDLVAKHGKMPKEGTEEYKIYKERIDYELSVLIDNDAGIDFMPYCFLLEDVCDYARKNDILYTSRGSAGGSLVLYVMNIVITNPLKHGLSFERFLNPGRIAGGSWPDVDLDWENRHLIVAYLKEKYDDKFAFIANDSKMKLKSSIKDAFRSVYGSVPEEIERLTVMIKVPLNVSDEAKWLYGSGDDDPEAFWNHPTDEVARDLRWVAKLHPEAWNMVNRCLGITRQRGIHAGGVVITPGPVHHHLPVIKTSSGADFATAYDMIGVEETGGVKYDMLGIKTLDALGIAIRSIKEAHGIDIPWDEFPEDESVFKNVIETMKLEGIFQLNTNVAKPYVRRIKPRNVTEMAALTALCRPGALDADAPDPTFKGSAAEYYVACAQGERQPYYVHPELEPILKETYGVIVYQEQAMKIGAQCAGYSEADADIIIRKGIGKKIQAKVEQFSNDLRERLPARGWTEDQINHLIGMIMASARYSFNKSHSVSYAIVAWNCAYIKHYYPAHYWKGMLKVFGSKAEKLTGMMDECGDRIRNIHILKSDPLDWLIEDGEFLRMPLDVIKGCGKKGVKKLRTFMTADFDTLAEIKAQEKAEKDAKKKQENTPTSELGFVGNIGDMSAEKGDGYAVE